MSSRLPRIPSLEKQRNRNGITGQELAGRAYHALMEFFGRSRLTLSEQEMALSMAADEVLDRRLSHTLTWCESMTPTDSGFREHEEVGDDDD